MKRNQFLTSDGLGGRISLSTPNPEVQVETSEIAARSNGILKRSMGFDREQDRPHTLTAHA
jgi:hypothetical protein